MLRLTTGTCGARRMSRRPHSSTRTRITGIGPRTRRRRPAPAAARAARRCHGGRGGARHAPPWRALRSRCRDGTGKGKGGGKTAGDAYEGDESFVDADGEIKIEDDWVDPIAPPSPVATPAPPPPPLKKSASSKGKGKRNSGKGEKAVQVPSVHYPFPVSVEEGASPPQCERQRERERNVTVSPRAGQRMHAARARDGADTERWRARGAHRGLSVRALGLVFVFDFYFLRFASRTHRYFTRSVSLSTLWGGY
jgi:hypothetical protein